METVNMHQAKTQLSKLIERASAGEEIVIARAGHPVARIVPLVSRTEPRKPGMLKGRIKLAENFDAPLPKELLAAFEGKGRRG